jgi:hypothetical protein
LESILSREYLNSNTVDTEQAFASAACQVPDILTYNTIETEIPEIFLLIKTAYHILFSSEHSLNKLLGHDSLAIFTVSKKQSSWLKFYFSP